MPRLGQYWSHLIWRWSGYRREGVKRCHLPGRDGAEQQGAGLALPFAKYDNDNNSGTDVIRRKWLRRRRSTSLNLSAYHPSSRGKTPSTSSRNRKQTTKQKKTFVQFRRCKSGGENPREHVALEIPAIWGRDAPLDIRWEATATEGAGAARLLPLTTSPPQPTLGIRQPLILIALDRGGTCTSGVA